MNGFPGRNWGIINITVNNSTDTEITFDVPIRSFFLKSRNGTTLYLRKTDGGTNYVTFAPGLVLDSEIILGQTNWSQSSLGFMRTDNAGGDVVEGIVIYS